MVTQNVRTLIKNSEIYFPNRSIRLVASLENFIKLARVNLKSHNNEIKNDREFIVMARWACEHRKILSEDRSLNHDGDNFLCAETQKAIRNVLLIIQHLLVCQRNVLF